MKRGYIGAALALVMLAACGPQETEAQREQRLLIEQQQLVAETALRDEVEDLRSQVGGYIALTLFGAVLGIWGWRRLRRRQAEREDDFAPLRTDLHKLKQTISSHELATTTARDSTAADLREADRLEHDAKALFADLRRAEREAHQ